MTPVVKLLRLMDGEKPAMGKVYDRMFMIGQKIDDRNFAWKSAAAKIYAVRWEYLHSEMHAAGYALDPEFMTMASGIWMGGDAERPDAVLAATSQDFAHLCISYETAAAPGGHTSRGSGRPHVHGIAHHSCRTAFYASSAGRECSRRWAGTAFPRGQKALRSYPRETFAACRNPDSGAVERWCDGEVVQVHPLAASYHYDSAPRATHHAATAAVSGTGSEQGAEELACSRQPPNLCLLARND